MDKSVFITKEGLQKVSQELEELRGVKRKEIAQRIQEAKELGDLSENAEYAEAKNEQSFTEGRIAELETIIKNATVIDESKKRKTNIVEVGSAITVAHNQSEKTFSIVGSNEADPANGRISNESPLGRAFLGRAIGDTVNVDVPKGVEQYTIKSIA